MPDQNPPPTAVAWTCKAGTHPAVVVEAAAVVGPTSRRVQLSGDLPSGAKALELDMPVTAAVALYDQLGDAIGVASARARRRAPLQAAA